MTRQSKSTLHICGQCQKNFSTESAYLKHMCPTVGSTPRTLNVSTSSQPKTTSILEKKILAAVQIARQEKRDSNA
jgi:predicted RNA-binding Zn-ribbon protein involved in translation (DUF1610 family)